MNLLERIEAARESLTERERIIANFLMTHYPQVAFESATAIGRKIKISPATVVRLFAKLGYDSFGDLQRELQREIAVRLKSPLQEDVSRGPGREAGEILRRILLRDIGNLESSFRDIDPAGFQRLVDRILAVKGRVFISGEKKSYSVAWYLYTQLVFCLPRVVLLESGQSLLVDRLLDVTPEDFLIAVDVRRYARAPVLVAKYFRRVGAEVATFADSPLSPISGIAHYRIFVSTKAPDFDSYTAVFSICNAIVAAVTERRKQAVKNAMDKGRDLWREFQIFTTREIADEGYPAPPRRRKRRK